VDRAGGHACPLKRMVPIIVAFPHRPKVVRAGLSVASVVQLGAASHTDVRVGGLHKAVPGEPAKFKVAVLMASEAEF
jgi:hypothetical protein